MVVELILCIYCSGFWSVLYPSSVPLVVCTDFWKVHSESCKNVSVGITMSVCLSMTPLELLNGFLSDLLLRSLLKSENILILIKTKHC